MIAMEIKLKGMRQSRSILFRISEISTQTEMRRVPSLKLSFCRLSPLKSWMMRMRNLWGQSRSRRSVMQFGLCSLTKHLAPMGAQSTFTVLCGKSLRLTWEGCSTGRGKKKKLVGPPTLLSWLWFQRKKILTLWTDSGQSHNSHNATLTRFSQKL